MTAASLCLCHAKLAESPARGIRSKPTSKQEKVLCMDGTLLLWHRSAAWVEDLKRGPAFSVTGPVNVAWLTADLNA